MPVALCFRGMPALRMTSASPAVPAGRSLERPAVARPWAACVDLACQTVKQPRKFSRRREKVCEALYDNVALLELVQCARSTGA